MTHKKRKYKLLGGGGKSKNGFFTVVATEVTEDYNSKIPLIASRRLKPDDDYQDIKKQCQDEFAEPEKWVVSQYRHHFPEERVGIQNFKLLRMDIFNQVWRKPIATKTDNFRSDGDGIYFYLAGPNEEWGSDHHFLLEWDHINGLSWLYKHDIIVYPFTDEERMFADPGDELAYIADVLNRRG